MKYLTEDAFGHVRSELEAKALRQALKLLNASETILAIEEGGNWHHARDERRTMASELHVAEIDGWESTSDGRYEYATCRICGGELERERQ